MVHGTYQFFRCTHHLFRHSSSVQRTDVFNAQPSFPIPLGCHTNGELLGGGKMDILLDT